MADAGRAGAVGDIEPDGLETENMVSMVALALAAARPALFTSDLVVVAVV